LKKIILCLFVFIILFPNCKDNNHHNQKNSLKLKFGKYKLTKYKVVKGEFLGASHEREEYYVIDKIASKMENKIIIKVFSINDGNLLNEIKLNKGDIASPSLLCSPTYFQSLDDNYFIYDLTEKIAVFGKDFNWKFSSRFHSNRNFIDFFKDKQKFYFLLGAWSKKHNGFDFAVEINEIQTENNNIVKKTGEIHSFSEKIKRHLTIKDGVKILGIDYFTPAVYGFEKKGKLLYTITTENKYFIYDLKNKIDKSINLSYLKGKIFKADDAQKAGYYRSDGLEEKRYLKTGLKINYVPYDKEIYHLGMYDVGIDKIGIVGDINLSEMQIRLDILNFEIGEYFESIKLPIGKNFLKGISKFGPQFRPSFFDYAKGVYVWEDKDKNSLESITILTKFKRSTL
jgi:predicted transposase YbfD/YdcC